MPVDPNRLGEYAGKHVILHLIKDDGSVAEVEGKVEDASEAGVAFKEKGKRDVSLVLPPEVEEIAIAPTKAKKVTQKKLKPVAINNVRQHLADRHGWEVAPLNDMTDEEAWQEHENIDHSTLGHRHEESKEEESSEEE